MRTERPTAPPTPPTPAPDAAHAAAIDAPEAGATADGLAEAGAPLQDALDADGDAPPAELGGRDARRTVGDALAALGANRQTLSAEMARLRQRNLHLDARAEDLTRPPRAATILAADAVDAGVIDLDAAKERGRAIVAEAGRRAHGHTSDTPTDTVGKSATGVGAVTRFVNIVGEGATSVLGQKIALGAGVGSILCAAITSYTSLGAAHEAAHAFNAREGYAAGYANGFAAALYDQPGPARRSALQTDAKRATYDRAFNAGAARGAADARRLSPQQRLEARLYIESEMAAANEEHLWGRTDVAARHIARAAER